MVVILEPATQAVPVAGWPVSVVGRLQRFLVPRGEGLVRLPH